MTSIISDNQTVSPGVYARTVQDQAALSHEFMKANAPRVDRAYAAGEPIWMIVAELKMVQEVQPTWKPTKTPRALASRVEIVR
jgi:hypothetical protein